MASNVVRIGQRSTAPRATAPLSSPVAPLVARRAATQRPHAGAPRPAAAPSAVRPAPGQPAQRTGRSAAQQRRQDVIVALLAASLLSFLATLTFSGLFLYLHVVIDLALVAYVGAVLVVTKRVQARSSQVSYLPERPAMPSTMVPVAAHSPRRTAAR